MSMKIYTDDKKNTYVTVQYNSEIKPLLLKMREYALKKQWDAFDKKLAKYKKAIFNSEIVDLGVTPSISKHEKDEHVFQQVFSQRNSQGIKHWWQEITEFGMIHLDPNKSFLEQTEAHPVTREKYINSLIEDYSLDLMEKFFKWYVKEYHKLKKIMEG